MLKPIVAIIFLLSFALQTFSTALIVADYFTNTASYISNCENKTKPQLHCNGKCGMMKNLQQEKQKDQQNPERKAENKGETAYLPVVFTGITSYVHNTSDIFHLHLSEGEILKMPRTVFHPPGA